MTRVLLALGAVCVAEGLLYAVAPRLVERLLEALRERSLEQRRLLGLGTLAAGVAMIWASRALGG